MGSVVTQPYRRPRDPVADNYLVTLAQEFDLRAAVASTGASVDLSDFLRVHPSGRARIWAVGVSAPARRAWAKMAPGDLVLLYGHGAVYAYGRIGSKTHWRKNNHVWPSGENWDHIYSFSEFTELPAGRRLEYQSLRKLASKLDLFAVGCRDIGEFGGSEEQLLEWVTVSGPRHNQPARVTSRSTAVASTQVQEWDVRPGEVWRRADLHRRFGGSKQSGISSSARTPNVMVFSDPEVGRAFGYDKHEGRREDGSYRYTGEGQVGHQVATSQGNAALLSAEERGRAIRLFIKDGRDATYIGEYSLGDPKYLVERARDRDGRERNVLVFNFVPVSSEAPLPHPHNVAPGPLLSNQYAVAPWTPPNDSDISVPGTGRVVSDSTISRKEMQLQGAYGRWLEEHGKEVAQISIPLDGGAVMMRPDLFNVSDKVLIEAKKSSGRQYVREAIGQVLDYVHNLKRCDHPIETTPAILLPARPAEDLVELCAALGIAVVYREGEAFTVA